MLNKDKAFEILSEAIRVSPADETEVILSGGKTFSTRFTNNYISQNGAQKEYDLTVRVAFGNQVGVASCNLFDGENLRKVVENACVAAKHSKPDLEWVPVLDNQEAYREMPQTYFEGTLDYSPEEKSARLEPILKEAIRRDLTAAGMLVNGDDMLTIMNSKGLFAYHNWTKSSLTFTAMASHSGSAWAEYHSPDVREIEVEQLTQSAMAKAERSRNPVAVDPGAYTVILEPPAVLELVEYLNYLGFGGRSFEEDRTFTAGHLGEKLFDERFTLVDDPFRWQVLGSPFDYEGRAKQPLTLVKNGVLQAVAYDRKTAKKAGKLPTGHALMPPNTMGPLAGNIFLEPGDQSVDQMIASTERGIYITRFWYSNMVDEKQATMTGMSRDGTFLIENGKLTQPLRNMRYNESLLKAFANIDAIGNRVYSFNGYFGKIGVPALKIRDFHFTGVSQE